MIPLSPVAVWDVRDPGWRDKREVRTAWLREHGLPANQMYRAEFFLVDMPFVRIFRYALNEQGKRCWTPGHIPGPHDHEMCDVAREEPRDVPLGEFPPCDLLGEDVVP